MATMEQERLAEARGTTAAMNAAVVEASTRPLVVNEVRKPVPGAWEVVVRIDWPLTR